MEMFMSQIAALSFDCISSPSITLKVDNKNNSFNWGFALYANHELAATIIKEAKLKRDSLFGEAIQDRSQFSSTLFLGHIRNVIQNLDRTDTQPFRRTYGGRDWVMIHSGDLNYHYTKKLVIQNNAIFEPIGNTDSEHIFCWILEKIRLNQSRQIADIEPALIHSWLQEINELGSVNILLSDGQDLLVYCDNNNFNPLAWTRSTPPHQCLCFESQNLQIEMSNALDEHHSFILFLNKTSINKDESFFPMQSGQLIIARNGIAIWSSHPQENLIIHNVPKPIEKVSKIRKKLEDPSLMFEQSGLTKLEQGIANIEKNIYIPNTVFDVEPTLMSITHETIYHYKIPVELSKHEFRLRPVQDQIQLVLDYQFQLSVDGYGESYEDTFGNIATYYTTTQAFTKLHIISKSIVAVFHIQELQLANLSANKIPLIWLPWQREMFSSYLLPTELPQSELEELIDFAMSFVKRNDYDLMGVLNDINQTIYREIKYVPGSTRLSTTPYEVFIHRKGVCQDFANLFICLARLLNIPARYRIGYLYTGVQTKSHVRSDASHAWVELYLPSLGWFGFDPTNGCHANESHIRVACGRQYRDATPTSGTIYKGGSGEKLSTTVAVVRLKDKK